LKEKVISCNHHHKGERKSLHKPSRTNNEGIAARFLLEQIQVDEIWTTVEEAEQLFLRAETTTKQERNPFQVISGSLELRKRS
jgi:hypothetical protein